MYSIGSMLSKPFFKRIIHGNQKKNLYSLYKSIYYKDIYLYATRFLKETLKLITRNIIKNLFLKPVHIVQLKKIRPSGRKNHSLYTIEYYLLLLLYILFHISVNS